MSAINAANKKEINRSTITINLVQSSKKARNDRFFQLEPGPSLMREYDQQSKELRKNFLDNQIEKIPYITDATPICKGLSNNKVVNTSIQEIDAIEYKQQQLDRFSYKKHVFMKVLMKEY